MSRPRLDGYPRPFRVADLSSRRGRNPVRYSVGASQGREVFPLPPIDVIFRDSGKQRIVAGAPFLERHCERLRDRAGHRFRIIGVDQYGPPKFDRGTSEARQDKNSRISAS